MDTFKDKLRSLWKDDRTFTKRMLIALFVNLFLAYTLMFHIPCETYIGSMSDFSFSFATMTKIMGVFAVLFTIAATLIVPLLRGAIYDLLVNGAFAFTLCCYMQGNFMNGSLAILNGETVQWHENTKAAMLNLLVWIVIFSMPFILRFFSKRIWDTVLRFASLFFVIIQASALVVLCLTSDFSVAVGDEYLSTNSLYETSDENDVIVFVVDFFDNSYADYLETYPGFFDELDGFTRYTNYSSVYKQTMPTIPYLLTGTKWELQTKSRSFAPYAFKNSDFLDRMIDGNIKINLYTKAGYIGKLGCTKAENYVRETPHVSKTGLFHAMEIATMYKCMPTAMKANFWYYTDDLSAIAGVVHQDGDEIAAAHSDGYTINDANFYAGLKSHGITKTEDEYSGHFKFIHLMGGHPPYTLNENGETDENATSDSQFKGCFKIIFEYLEGLREQGTYDNTTVIITADHGIVYITEELETAPSPLLLVKPAGSRGEFRHSSAPLTQEDFHATVLEAFDIDGSDYGDTFFDFKEGDERTRYFYYRVALTDDAPERIIEYEINGEVTDFSNWRLTGKEWTPEQGNEE